MLKCLRHRPYSGPREVNRIATYKNAVLRFVSLILGEFRWIASRICVNHLVNSSI